MTEGMSIFCQLLMSLFCNGSYIIYDHRYGHFLSTAHVPYLGDGSLPEVLRKDGRKKLPVPCPPLLFDYVKNMRGVNRGDQLIILYTIGRKSLQAWKRIMYYLFECCILNAYVIEGHFDKRHTSSKRDFLKFRIELATSLIDGYTGRKQGAIIKDMSIGRLNPILAPLTVFAATKKRCVLRSKKGVGHECGVVCKVFVLWLGWR